jgi:NDP-sugar pyrophosphorylase family protein
MLHAYVIKGKWITINTYKDLLEARELLKEIE